MRRLIAILAAVLVTACADATSPLTPKVNNDIHAICPVLVRADTILGDTNNIIRYYQFPGDNILYFVGPFGYPQNIPPCR